MRRILALGSLALASCGGEGTWTRCQGDADCAVPQVCSRPVADEPGVCVAPLLVAIRSPLAGAWVKKGGADVRAVAVPATGAVPVPTSLLLRVDGAAAGPLALQPDGSYLGHWDPGASPPPTARLEAVANAGTAAEVSSAPVSVKVDVEEPVLGAVGASCPGRSDCERDGTLDLSVAGGSADLTSVTATLDLDALRVVPLGPSGGEWRASVALAGYGFPHFARVVQVTVRGEDQAGNAVATTVSVTVTRLRWAATVVGAGVAVTSPAILGDGTAVVGASNRLVGIAPTGVESWRATVGTGAIAAAPSVGPTAIWVASQDGRIYATDGAGTVLNGTGCNTSSLPVGTPALSAGSPELAFAGTTTARALFAARVNPALCNGTSAGDPFAGSAAVAPAGAIYAATVAAAGAANVHRFSDPGTGLLVRDWSTATGSNVVAPLALDAAGRVLVSSQDGTLHRVTDGGTTGTATPLATLSARAVASPVVLGNGDIVVGTAVGKVHRVSDAGSEVWATPPDLGSEVTGLAAASAEAAVYAVTALGRVFALRGDGTQVWATEPGPLAGGPLGFPTIAPPLPARLPTLYAGSQDGKLYAIAVDGELDATAPWPKAHHDARNTGNAASPLP